MPNDPNDPFDDLFEPFDPSRGQPSGQRPVPVEATDPGVATPEGTYVYCASCGNPNHPSNRHCEMCGARIARSQTPVAPQPMLRTTAGARALVVLSSGDVGPALVCTAIPTLIVAGVLALKFPEIVRSIELRQRRKVEEKREVQLATRARVQVPVDAPLEPELDAEEEQEQALLDAASAARAREASAE